MLNRYLPILFVIAGSLFFAPLIAHSDSLPQNCISIEEVKFSYIAKDNYRFAGQKIWLRFTNNCGIDIDSDNFNLSGYTTKDADQQNWILNFGTAMLPVKSGAVGYSWGEYKAKDAALMKITIKKGSTVLAEKIFEPKDFDKMRALRETKGRSLEKSPLQPKNLPRLK